MKLFKLLGSYWSKYILYIWAVIGIYKYVDTCEH